MSIDGGSIELAHFTVEEFLCGTALSLIHLDKMNYKLASYHINESAVDLELAKTCLSYLNLEDFDTLIPETVEEWTKSVDSHPFRRNAVTNMYKHAQNHWDEEDLLSLGKSLFNPSRSRNFNCWALDWALTVRAVIFLQDGLRLITADDNKRVSYEEILYCATSYGISTLHFACLIRAPPLVNWLLAKGVHVNQLSRFGSPLHCVLLGDTGLTIFCCHGTKSYIFNESLVHLDDSALLIIDALIGAGADWEIHFPGSKGPRHSIFSWLAFLDHREEEVVKRFFDMLSVSGIKLGPKFLAAVKLRIQNEEAQDLSIILNCLGPLNIKESQLFDFLRLAALVGGSFSFNWLDFIQASEDITARNNLYKIMPALETAIRHDYVQEVRKIVHEYRPSLEEDLPSEHLPALHVAAKYGASSSAQILLEAGANVHHTDHNGQTAIFHSAANNSPTITKLLLERGASVKHLDHEALTIFHVSASSDNVHVLRLLINHSVFEKSSLTQKSHRGKTPLQEAAENLAEATMLFLVERFEDLSGQYDVCDSKLIEKAVLMQPRILELCLVKMDLDIHAQDKVKLLHQYVSDAKVPSKQHLMMLTDLSAEKRHLNEYRRTLLHTLFVRSGWSAEWLGEFIHTLAIPANIDLQDCYGNTALHYFLSRPSGHLKTRQTLRILLGLGANLEVLDSMGENYFDTLLSSKTATVSMDPTDDDLLRLSNTSEIYLEMFERIPQADFLQWDTSTTSKLTVWAIRASQDSLLNLLLARHTTVHSQVLMQIAQEKLPFAMVQKVLSKTSPTFFSNVHSGFKNSMLHILCHHVSRADIKVLETVLACGPQLDVLTQDQNRMTALMLAANADKLEHVQLLLKHNADARVTSVDGWKALHYAVNKGSFAVARLLLVQQSYDSSPIVIPSFDSNSQTMLFYNANLIHLATRSPKILEHILRSYDTTDIDTPDQHDNTAAHLAAREGQAESLDILSDHRAQLGYKNSNGDTALHFAAYEGHVRIIQLLLDKGLSVNLRNEKGTLPIHFAALRGREEAVLLLLKAGSELTADDYGLTPELYALLASHPQTAGVINRVASSNSKFGVKIATLLLTRLLRASVRA